MRVSTSMIFNNGTLGIQNRQSDLFKVQNQLSNGRRILTPEDDPIGASEALQVTQSKGVNKQFLDNQANAQSQLTYLEGTLGSVSDQFLRIGELAAEAANPTLNASQRGMIAAELKERRDSLIGLANTQDGTGLYIFGGFKSSIKPFGPAVAQASPPVLPPTYGLAGTTYVPYNGDAGRQALQVTSSNDIATSENGLDVFMQVKDSSGNAIGRSVFDSLQNLINNIDGSSPYSAATQAQAQSEIRAGLNHVSTIRASVGARQNSLDSLTSTGQDVALQYDTRLSDLQDLDWTEAISRFTNYKTQLEAAQLSFKQVSQMSLFNIL